MGFKNHILCEAFSIENGKKGGWAMKKFIFNKLVPGVTSAVAALAVPMTGFAVTIKDDLNAETVVGNILDYLLLAGQLVGGGVLIYAFITFGLSIAQENPDQRSRAIMFIVAGAFLVGIKPILKAIGVIS